MSTRIVPTNGRVMLYHPMTPPGRTDPVQHDVTKPLAAIVTHVWGDDMVNLAVFDSNGTVWSRTSVPIVQEGSPYTAGPSPYAEWMPYQKGQAAKHETPIELSRRGQA